jgi:hypothetical protein
MVMTSSWQMKEGRLVWGWSGQMGPSEYKPSWMQTSTEIQGGYLPPAPDFSSHSPFGGPSWFWFLPEGYYRNPE